MEANFWATADTSVCRYEREGRYRRKVKAQTLWYAIIESQVETGVPYMVYKDASNRKSNQQNIGTIKCSNLCTEIIEYSSPEEVRQCANRGRMQGRIWGFGLLAITVYCSRF